jgi:integrase
LEPAVISTKTEKLTNTMVARLAHAHKQQFYIVRDTEVGGFYIRVTATSKVYKYVCDVTEAGKRVTRGFTIGTSAKMTADAARLEVEKLAIQRKEGTLPKLSKATLSPPNIGITLGEAWVQFKDASIKEGKKPSTIAFYELVLRTHLKLWLDMPLKNITRSMVKELHGKISRKHPARANQVIVTGGAVYTFARADLEEVDLPMLSPWRGRKLFNKIKPRQTGLATVSLPGWWCKVDRLNSVLREANWLGILTGLRKENLIALRWDQINIKNRYISIDPESMKSGEPFKLPMSRAIIRCLWRARKRKPHVARG